MKYGVHMLTWGKYFDPAADPLEFFRQVRSTGAETVEFRPPDAVINGDMARAAEIKHMAEDNGLALLFCFGYPPGLDMRSPNDFARAYAVEHLKKAVRAAAALGGTEVGGVLYSNWPTSYANDMITPEVRRERRERSLACIKEVMPLAEDVGIKVNLEVLNRFEDYIINTVDEGLEFIDEVGSPNCGLVLDTFHMSIEEDDIPAAIRRAAGHIGQFHACEPNRRLPFHNTRIDWLEVGRALRDAGYDRTTTLECIMCFDGVRSYNLRMWRNELDDTSLESRLAAMGESLRFIRGEFEKNGAVYP